MYQLHGAPLNAETVGGPGKNTLLPPPLSGPVTELGLSKTFQQIVTLSLGIVSRTID